MPLLPTGQSFHLKLIEKAGKYALKTKSKIVEAMELITEIARLAVPNGRCIAPKDQIRLELCCFKLNRLLPKARLLEPIHELVFDEDYSIQDMIEFLQFNPFPRKLLISGPKLDEFDEPLQQLFVDTLANDCSSRSPRIEIYADDYCERNLLVLEKYYRRPFDCFFEHISDSQKNELLSLLQNVSIKTLTLPHKDSGRLEMVDVQSFVDGCIKSKCLVSCRLLSPALTVLGDNLLRQLY